MTEKVRLTQKQADTVERTKAVRGSRGVVLGYVARDTEIPNPTFRSLSDLTFDELARALYEPDSYEVEPLFKVGDQIVNINGVNFVNGLNVVEVEKVSEFFVTFCGDIGALKSNVRRATPEEVKDEKECRVWAEADRGYGKFRYGDVYSHNGSSIHIDTAKAMDTANVRYKAGLVTGFHPIESYVRFEEDSNA
ncbi:hypothetical protein [Sporosarcina sp. E16_8]|uniref:hypothetical protein n=1 Tax=Sporosarcina sp. E16_8 TaxID=2789295 RepID=UPI001A937B2A|nr:hypothetical protein [Sporosarcina sp. E16_8]MBO0586141.1 hypothetical protein [Sporosarcina sp. E16_8]